MTMTSSLQRALFEVELNSLCDSFSNMRVSPLPPKPVVVETVLEEHAMKRDGIFYAVDDFTTQDDVEETIYRQGAKDRMLKLEHQRYIDQMIERGTPYCVCFPINDDECVLVDVTVTEDDDGNNNNSYNNDESIVSVENMDMEVQPNDKQKTRSIDDDDNNDNETASTTATTTSVTDDEKDDDDDVDMIPDMSTSTTSEEIEGMLDDDLLLDGLLIDLAKYLATSTVNVATPALKFILNFVVLLPVAIVTYLLLKSIKRVYNTIFKSENEFDDDCSLPPLPPRDQTSFDPEEMFEILNSHGYETEEEFRKRFEFEFATPVYTYDYFCFDIAEAKRRREEEEEDMAWELENKPWWKFW